MSMETGSSLISVVPIVPTLAKRFVISVLMSFKTLQRANEGRRYPLGLGQDAQKFECWQIAERRTTIGQHEDRLVDDLKAVARKLR